MVLHKSAVDGLIQQTYTDRPSMLKNFSEIFFADPEKLSSEFKIWNLSLGLSASGACDDSMCNRVKRC